MRPRKMSTILNDVLSIVDKTEHAVSDAYAFGMQQLERRCRIRRALTGAQAAAAARALSAAGSTQPPKPTAMRL